MIVHHVTRRHQFHHRSYLSTRPNNDSSLLKLRDPLPEKCLKKYPCFMFLSFY